ncbi:hypothetical protein AVEN_109308-1 [Araneus ventricosus]|uniref:Uncharacterized protein n=1 Tax=Araneus ventricosus TaxID=182803 RepID=A0A4Y2D3J1_ARAVE|nr:hypothetical protein AVEN_109308-1 [Araneus ventricosus]
MDTWGRGRYSPAPEEKQVGDGSCFDRGGEVGAIGDRRAYSLDISTSRFVATQGLFWDGPRHFEPPQMTMKTSEIVTTLLNYRTTSAGGCLTPTYDLTSNSDSSVESGIEPETL